MAAWSLTGAISVGLGPTLRHVKIAKRGLSKQLSKLFKYVIQLSVYPTLFAATVMSTEVKYENEVVKVDVFPDGVAHVQLNRPKRLNAFNNA